MTSKGANVWQTLASETMAGKTSLTGSTIQARAAVTGVLRKRNVLTSTLIPMLLLILIIIIIIIIIILIVLVFSVIKRNDNDNAIDSKNKDIMMT